MHVMENLKSYKTSCSCPPLLTACSFIKKSAPCLNLNYISPCKGESILSTCLFLSPAQSVQQTFHALTQERSTLKINHVNGKKTFLGNSQRFWWRECVSRFQGRTGTEEVLTRDRNKICFRIVQRFGFYLFFKCYSLLFLPLLSSNG